MTIYDIRKAYFFLSITISLAGLCVSVGAQESGEYGAIKIQRTTLPIASVRFRCEPAPGLTAGEVVTAVIAKDGSQAWSIRRERVFVGSDQMSFPAMGMLLASDGTYHTLVLSQVKFLIAISRRKELKDKNYFIYACRDIQDGETLSAYIVGNGDAIILIEACSISTQRETVRVPAALISRQPINADQLAESLYVDFWRRTMKAGKKAQSTKTNYELKTSTFHKYEIESFEFDAGQRMVPRGATWDGKNLWVAAHNSANKFGIYRINETGSILTSFKPPKGHPEALAWDGTNLWVAQKYPNRIYCLTTGGTILSSIPSPGERHGHWRGLAWDGEHLWYSDTAASEIFQINTVGDVLFSFRPSGCNPESLTWDGAHLLCGCRPTGHSKPSKICRFTAAGELVETFWAPCEASGLGWDSTYLWYVDYTRGRIYKERRAPK